MTKSEFLASLRLGLAGLPQEDIEDRISFYGEMIDDRMEENMTEEEAVNALGTVDSVVSQILSEVPLAKIVKERIKPKRKLSVLEIILLAVGSPIWISLSVACIAVVLSVYAVIWAVVAVLWAVEAAFISCGVLGLIGGILDLIRGVPAEGALLLGTGLVFGGLAIFLFAGCVSVTKLMARLTGWIALKVKTLFVKKEK